jgi:pseudoazurin
MRQALMAAVLVISTSAPALADVIEVEMLNRNDDGERMVFSQELIRAEVGDTIRFVPTDKSHNAQSVNDALPAGQEPFRGGVNQEVEYVVTETGLTAVVCLPHQTMGMVALVVVGNDFSNAGQVLEARIPGKGGDKIAALVEEARATVPAEADAETLGS